MRYIVLLLAASLVLPSASAAVQIVKIKTTKQSKAKHPKSHSGKHHSHNHVN